MYLKGLFQLSTRTRVVSEWALRRVWKACGSALADLVGAGSVRAGLLLGPQVSET